MTTGRFRFIASNLHSGGGVQVAASLVDEMATLAEDPQWACLIDRTDVELSTAVKRNAAPETSSRLGAVTVDRRPQQFSELLKDAFRRHEGVLTVFGPIFSFPRARRRVMGYADVTSLYPRAIGRRNAKTEIRGALSRLEAAAQDWIIVETDAMRERVRAKLGSGVPTVLVVPNAVNARVLTSPVDENLAEQIYRGRKGVDALLAYPTRAYPHKNLGILPAVAARLSKAGARVRFLVTLRQDEWMAAAPDFRDVCTNLGELNVAQIPTMLKCSDGVFFPSLLEAYSATPIEALALGVPLYASDRDFVRTVSHSAALYFDPTDPQSAADAILRGLEDAVGRRLRTKEGHAIAASLPSSSDRAVAILSTLFGC